jgi:hypothetical protein
MSIASQRPVSEFLHAPRISNAGWRKALLACGVAFPLLWIGMDGVASLSYDGYSYRDQTISELSAIGAPTRTFWMVFGTVWGLLVIAFAAGVWQSAGRKRALRVVAGLLVANAVISLTLWPLSSMHQREVLAAGGATFSDTLHLILVGVGGIFFLFESGFAAATLGKRFRLYSIGTVIAVLVFGFITSLYAPEVQANEATPWVGIYERISAYGSQLWYTVLAVALWRLGATVTERRESN